MIESEEQSNGKRRKALLAECGMIWDVRIELLPIPWSPFSESIILLQPFPDECATGLRARHSYCGRNS